MNENCAGGDRELSTTIRRLWLLVGRRRGSVGIEMTERIALIKLKASRDEILFNSDSDDNSSGIVWG